jgi:hypothetical protein
MIVQNVAQVALIALLLVSRLLLPTRHTPNIHLRTRRHLRHPRHKPQVTGHGPARSRATDRATQRHTFYVITCNYMKS